MEKNWNKLLKNGNIKLVNLTFADFGCTIAIICQRKVNNIELTLFTGIVNEFEYGTYLFNCTDMYKLNVV
jgi:hypothetical protein